MKTKGEMAPRTRTSGLEKNSWGKRAARGARGTARRFPGDLGGGVAAAVAEAAHRVSQSFDYLHPRAELRLTAASLRYQGSTGDGDGAERRRRRLRRAAPRLSPSSLFPSILAAVGDTEAAAAR